MSAPSTYLDNNATTRVAPEVLEAMLPYLTSCYGNPSSTHRAGVEAREGLIRARGAVAALLSARPAEIIFTSGCTESNHHAILGALAAAPGKRRIVTSAVEHPSTLMLLRDLEQQGFTITLLPVGSSGEIDAREFEAALTCEVALVSLMWANNETGVVFPIAEFAAKTKERGILFHTDAAQAAGRIPIDLTAVPADLLSFSGHKFHAPKGVGGLFVRTGLKLPMLIRGHQERRRRGGTENLPAIAGLGAACTTAAQSMLGDAERIGDLRDRLEAGLMNAFAGISVNGGDSQRLPNTSNVCFGEIDGEALLARLDQRGVFASSGAACSSGGSEPSHVLTAMGLGRDRAASSVRFSLSRYTTAAEIERVVEIVPEIVRELSAVEDHVRAAV
jgi:cysteine desulfurase